MVAGCFVGVNSKKRSPPKMGGGKFYMGVPLLFVRARSSARNKNQLNRAKENTRLVPRSFRKTAIVVSFCHFLTFSLLRISTSWPQNL
jgi:hypothetical protein